MVKEKIIETRDKISSLPSKPTKWEKNDFLR
jgi:hypothetical protein